MAYHFIAHRAGRVPFRCDTYHEPHGMSLKPSGWKYISTILLHSNANDFSNGFHRVESKVARAFNKIIQVVLFGSCHFWDMGWIVEWRQRAVWSEYTSTVSSLLGIDRPSLQTSVLYNGLLLRNRPFKYSIPCLAYETCDPTTRICGVSYMRRTITRGLRSTNNN